MKSRHISHLLHERGGSSEENILSAQGHRILGSYGFAAPTLP